MSKLIKVAAIRCSYSEIALLRRCGYRDLGMHDVDSKIKINTKEVLQFLKSISKDRKESVRQRFFSKQLISKIEEFVKNGFVKERRGRKLGTVLKKKSVVGSTSKKKKKVLVKSKVGKKASKKKLKKRKSSN